MTEVSSLKTDPTLGNIEVVGNYLAALPIGGITLDLGVLGFPHRHSEPQAGELAYPIRLYAGTAVLGPLYRTDGSSAPCVECLERRWLALRPVEERRAVEDGTEFFALQEDGSCAPFVLEQLAQLVLAETAAGLPGSGLGRIVELRFADLSVTRHDLLPDSECERCATPAADTAEAAAMPLHSRPKRHASAYRGAKVSELALPLGAYINELCGSLAKKTLQVYQCSATLPVSGYFRVRSKYDYHEMWWSGQSQNVASSERYGVLEGLERYAGQFPRAKRTSVYGSYHELRPDALDPAVVGSYRQEFYASHPEYYEPFDRDTRMRWVWGYSFAEQRPMLVPEQLVYYLDRHPDKKFVQESSSGCASGTSAEEALLHGMLELIERDAFLLCWYAGARLPEIDTATCADEEIQFILDRVSRLGYRMRLFDMRVDIGVPAVMAVAERLDGGLGRLCFAAGASMDPIEAVRSAISETASYIPGMDERVEARLPELKAMVHDYGQVHELVQHALLYGLPEMASVADFLLDAEPARSMQSLYADWLEQRPGTLDLADDVRFLLDRIAAVGSDVVVVDQTCPEQHGAGVHTLAVTAPGLIPIDFGWARQRALDHPRLQAYLDGRLAEISAREHGFGPTGLNPRPHPFP
jgi:ribosomal protein S12 methylthiotransferase accessory factor